MAFAGELAALGAALAFSVTSTAFTLAGRSYSPVLLMRASLPIGLVCILGLHWWLTGAIVPGGAYPIQWVWLGISGIIGFWLGSIAIVNAFARIGPRLTLLVTALAPILSTVLAWIFLDQTLERDSLTGIALTLAGIAFVVSGRRGNTGTLPADGSYWAGVGFAMLGAIGQASSFIFSTEALTYQGMTTGRVLMTPVAGLMDAGTLDFLANPGGFHPLSASLMRIFVATIAIWLAAILRRRVQANLRRVHDNRDGLRFLLVGSIAGPVIGASLVLVSLQLIPVGISSTLTNLTPIFLIPISAVVFREQITGRAMVGTVIAVTGTALIFL